jgi:hypothetical protein
MTDQPQPSIGTVAEEAARLISAVATMARSSAVPSEDPANDPSPYAGGPARDSMPPHAGHVPPGSGPVPPPHAGTMPPDAGPQRAEHTCSACGGESSGTPVACKLCPLCQGIALLRSIRPETVDRLADLASAMAESLRDMATQSRASGPASDARAQPGMRPNGVTVQDIRVDDEK